MARRSLLPSPPHLPTPGSPASSPATPLLLRPLRSLGEIPRPRRGTTCGIALRRPSSSRATAAEPRAARAGRPQRRAPPPGPPPHTNNLLRPPSALRPRPEWELPRNGSHGLARLTGRRSLGKPRERGRPCPAVSCGALFCNTLPPNTSPRLCFRSVGSGCRNKGALPRPGAFRAARGSRVFARSQILPVR